MTRFASGARFHLSRRGARRKANTTMNTTTPASPLATYLALLDAFDGVTVKSDAVFAAQNAALGNAPVANATLVLRWAEGGVAKTRTFSGVGMTERAQDAARRVLGWQRVTDVTLRFV